METNYCKCCNKDLPITNFGSIGKGNRRNICKDCYGKRYGHKRKQASKRHYEKNKDRYKKNATSWRLSNEDKFKEIQKDYYKNHTEELLEKSKLHRKSNPKYYSNYAKEREKFDINFKIKRRLRNRLYSVVLKGYKSQKTLDLIGCSLNELRIHLENQFKDNMSWENYGEWHIDHIKPCDSYDLTKEDDQRECFNYKNLQPLWAKDNLIKKNKYEN